MECLELQRGCLKPVHDSEFQLIRRMVYRETGIFLNDHKKTMLANRLRNRLHTLGFKSYKQYYDYITKHPAGKRELSSCIDCLTTNQTYFFRHIEHMEYVIRHILPECCARRKSGEKIRIWSIGCSSGEEPISIVILLDKRLKKSERDRIEIVASDISRSMIDRAGRGLYAEYAFQRMSEADRNRFFTWCSDTGLYRIRPEIQQRVRYFQHNILDPFHHGSFDVIFCRNVLIYFNKESKGKALTNIRKHLRPDGLLIMGFAESLIDQRSHFTYIKPTVYRRLED